MTNTTNRAAPTTVKTATHSRVTCTTDGKSVTFRDDADAPADALSRRAAQLNALLSLVLAESEDDCRVSSPVMNGALWLASDLSREIRLLAEVAT